MLWSADHVDKAVELVSQESRRRRWLVLRSGSEVREGIGSLRFKDGGQKFAAGSLHTQDILRLRDA